MPDDVDIKEEIEKLVRLQELDTEAFDLQARKEEIPVKLKQMDDSLKTKMGGMKSAEDTLKALQVLKNEKETEMQAMEEKISKYEGDLYQIKNNKEYQALQQEIDSVKADVSLAEETIINLLDEIEAAQAAFEDEKKIFETETQNAEKEKGSMKEEEKKLGEQLGELTAKRTEIAGTISPDILNEYERILENRGRVALVEINGEFCGACNLQMRPQVINEARLKKRIILCENCTRILYAKD